MANKKLKGSLAWKLSDFVASGEEPPSCVMDGKTEGEVMSDEDVESWCRESVQQLYVFREEYPNIFRDHLEIFCLDLDYLLSLGKITEEERKEIKKKEIFKVEK